MSTALRLQIDRLGHRGDGIAAGPDGQVLVARALPGETVEGSVEAGRIARPRILIPSPARRVPPCRHYDACGGCALQHASDGFVAGWKADVVRQALSAQGLEAPIRGIATSPPRSRRRAVIAARRAGEGAVAGFHGRRSETIVDVEDCDVIRPELLALLPRLRRLAMLGATRRGEIAFTATLTEGGVDLAASGGRAAEPALFETLAREAGEAGLARLAWNGETIAARQPATLRFGAALVAPPPGAFLQATAEGEAALLASVRAALRETGAPARIADLFAGCGTFALPLAARAEVHAVEGDAAMTAALAAAARVTPGLRHVGTETRDLFRRPLLPAELARFDAVVIDPPRAGAEAQAAELARAAVPVIAHVSCNPATFARDARLLIRGGYRLDWIRIVDQFRWSTHVELAARFSRPD